MSVGQQTSLLLELVALERKLLLLLLLQAADNWKPLGIARKWAAAVDVEHVDVASVVSAELMVAEPKLDALQALKQVVVVVVGCEPTERLALFALLSSI